MSGALNRLIEKQSGPVADKIDVLVAETKKQTKTLTEMVKLLKKIYEEIRDANKARI